jgi:ABC-type dipeptide/oligopeptide/nickel transport system permease subunit
MATAIQDRSSTAQAQAQARVDQLALRTPPISFWQDVWRRLRRDRLAMMAAVTFLSLCLLSLAAPLISTYVTGYDPDRINLRDQYAPPSRSHWFGADEYGRDYFTRIIYAGRISLAIGFGFALISLTIGVLLGVAGGYYSGVFDDILQNAINVISAIPFLPLLIIISSMFKPNVAMLVLILSAFGWIGASRYMRGLVLSLKQRDYILAARTVGARDNRIMFTHILPNVFSAALIIVGFDIAGAILTESTLSFLGFGVQPPTASWGNMLSNARSYMSKSPWLVFFPGLFISLTVLSVYLLADGLRDAMDPRLRR